METGKSKVRGRKPLSDCTNSAVARSRSSTAALSSSVSKSKKRILSSAINELPSDSPRNHDTNSSGTTQNDFSEVSHASSSLQSPTDFTPSRPSRPSTSSGAADFEVFEPRSSNSRRRTASRRNETKKAMDKPPSHSAASKSEANRRTTKEDGCSALAETCSVPRPKRQRRTTSRQDTSDYILPQGFIEQQRAYFAEIDAFELLEEEVTSADDLE